MNTTNFGFFVFLHDIVIYGYYIEWMKVWQAENTCKWVGFQVFKITLKCMNS